MESLDHIRSLGDIVRHHARVRPDKVAMRFLGRTTTYGELNERADRLCTALAAAGIGAGDRVALLTKNTDRWFELCFATAKLGAVLVPVNFRLAPPEVAYVVNDSGARLFIVGRDFYELVGHVRADLRGVERIVAFDGGHAAWPDYTAWRDEAAARDPMLPVAETDVAIQMYTSGTTGHPKGAQLTHIGFLALFRAWRATIAAMDERDVVNVVMPLFHVAGSEWGKLALFSGAEIVIEPEVDPAAILTSIETYRVTKGLFVPAVILFLMQHPASAATDFSSLEEIYYGASPIPLPLLQQALQRVGCRFVQLYGLTETTGAVTWLPAEDHSPQGTPRMKSCGKALPTAAVRVVDEAGNDVPAGAVGEIIIRSAQNMTGYWHLPEVNDAAFRGGWFHSGDAGYLDEDGYVYIYDRVKDMIVSGGENVYPAEVESALFGHPAVADVAVIGVPDDRWGEAVKAIIVLKPGQMATPAELIAWARERIAGYKVPKSVDFAEALPRNPSGKILKRELRKPYWEGQERQVS
jgi:acyl-CoA synthetase (AMP-forming)/AMP-acid ligase II